MPPEVIIVPAIFGIPALVLLARMWFRHTEKMASIAAGAGEGHALEARMARVEQAVDAIALEVERVGEGQRYLTRLLAERPAPELRDALPSERPNTSR